MVAFDVNQRENWLMVNKVTSVYGRDNDINYINTNIENGNLLYIDEKESLKFDIRKGVTTTDRY